MNSGTEANETAFKLARHYAWCVIARSKPKLLPSITLFMVVAVYRFGGWAAKIFRRLWAEPADIIHVPFNDLHAVKAVMEITPVRWWLSRSRARAA